ncbi:Uncharacterized conserved protein YjiS, DUF1127 family [Limimonas halophila]|uniref:Uncharacterized conserved protein YjiS, DUF1127 family n=1 Tax=Limimonas halophila TaxID=1082479 RepID=A0A1G7PVF9_9PROT|nr:Uncharacterized conserved protein YjiS, DUF1127 family [Limimonas halophila]
MGTIKAQRGTVRRLLAAPSPVAPVRGIGRALNHVPGMLVRTLRQWRRRARGRAELAGLDARARADLGVRWEDARAESRKPGWRA